MKNFIAITATLAALGFAGVLAASEESIMTCVDSFGKSHLLGNPGYESCVIEQRQSRREQAGQVPDFRNADLMPQPEPSPTEDPRHRGPLEPDYPY